MTNLYRDDFDSSLLLLHLDIFRETFPSELKSPALSLYDVRKHIQSLLRGRAFLDQWGCQAIEAGFGPASTNAVSKIIVLTINKACVNSRLEFEIIFVLNRFYQGSPITVEPPWFKGYRHIHFVTRFSLLWNSLHDSWLHLTSLLIWLVNSKLLN